MHATCWTPREILTCGSYICLINSLRPCRSPIGSVMRGVLAALIPWGLACRVRSQLLAYLLADTVPFGTLFRVPSPQHNSLLSKPIIQGTGERLYSAFTIVIRAVHAPTHPFAYSGLLSCCLFLLDTFPAIPFLFACPCSPSLPILFRFFCGLSCTVRA